MQPGEVDTLKIVYRGEPLESGFGSFSQNRHNGIPIISTLSEPYDAMEWWPCKQSLTDKIDSTDIFVTTPEPYFTASNGVLVSEKVENGFRTMHWKHRYPIAIYLVAIAVTNYLRYSDYLEMESGDSIEILNYVYPENLEYAKANTPVSKTSEIVKSPVRELAYEIVVYPNPFGKVLTISVQENAIPFHVKLFSVERRLLNQFEVSHSEYKIENLSQGIYILQVETKNGVLNEKIIRQ